MNKAKKIILSKRNNKEFGKEGVNVESKRNKIIKHSSFKEISLILNNTSKNNFKSKSKENKKINLSKDFFDEKKKLLESPINLNKKNYLEVMDKNSNFKSSKQKKNSANGNNRLNNKYIPKQKKKILIYNINNGLNSNYNLYTNSNSNNENTCLSFSNRTNEEKKLAQEEILDLNLINNRLKNEIQILTEKNKSLNEILEIKNKDIEILKNNNNQLYNETNDELLILKKKYENDIMKQKKNYDKSIAIIKSLINITIELCETILINGNNNINNNIFKSIKPKINGLDNNSLFDNSLDIYECNNTYSTQDIINFNKEEEKKANLLKQIKEIILEKINFITKELNLILDSSFVEKIEHIHSWNIQQIKSFPNFSFLLSNIKRSNTNNNSINNISINDDFDFSVSKSFYNHSQDGSISPKFNNSSFHSNNNKNIESKIKNKMPMNISNESKSLICSFNEISNNQKEENNKKDIIIANEPKKIINILEYSMVDLNEDENYNKNLVNENDNNKKNDKIEDKKNENFNLNSLSFNNEIINEKKDNDNIKEEAKLLLIDKENNKNNSSNFEYKSENSLNNFTLKNI